MRRPYNNVIRALKDSLSKPDLDPRAREVLERRLEYHREKLKQTKRETSSKILLKAREVSTQRRVEKARRITQELLPLILKLRGEGRTYKEIEDYLRRAGAINSRGTFYSDVSIRGMVINNSPRLASGRKVDPSVRRLAD